MLLPTRITALGQAEVSPKDAFVVRAPLDGVIDRFDIQPNQPVRNGAALFSLDTTTLRTRVDLARQAVDTAQEEYRQSAQRAMSNDKNRAEVALRLSKLHEKSVEMDFTVEQLDRIQVKADREGVAVFADTHDWIGKVVTVGERVLQIADPGKVELVVWFPVADLLPIVPGDTLSFYPQGSPLSSLDATVTSVAYRAEATRDGVLAYRVKADFAPGVAPPRLGQLGSARSRGGWAPLVYVALRRPLAAARPWLGW
jgi:multidrug resistance efflux pump